MPTDDEDTLGTRSEDVPTDPKAFDLGAWISGLRPTLRSCTLYARTDLLAEIDALKSSYDLATDSDVRTEIAREADVLRTEVLDSAVTVTVRAHGETANDEIRSGLGLSKGDTPNLRQNLGFIAAHVVEPEGLDVDALEAIYRASPLQVDKLARIVLNTDRTAPEVPAPFSR